MRARVCVTGMAAVTASGRNTEEVWKAALNETSGLTPISRFDGSTYPVRVVGEVPDTWAVDDVPRQLGVQTDRWTQLALALGERALADAGLDVHRLPPYATAVVTSSSSGGNEFGQVEIERLWGIGPERVGPYQSIAWFYAATTGQLSIHHGFKGPCGVISAEQAGGLDAIAQARRLVRRGTSVAVTGGTEAPVGPYALTCQLTSGLLSEEVDPAIAYLPFDSRSSGYVPGEGGAILVTEDLQDARRRSVDTVHGEIAGCAATFDGAGRSTLHRTIELALADARLAAGDVDVVFADALGTTAADAAEAEALATVFGPRAVPVAVPKTMFGRLYAGGPAVDAVVAMLAMRDGVLPPAGVRPDPDLPIDVVTEARETTVRTALVLARGYGGFNAALVLRAV